MRNYFDVPTTQASRFYIHDTLPISEYKAKPWETICSKYNDTRVNRNKCPIFTASWAHDGTRLITGANSGELLMWDSMTFKFVTILQAHERAIKAMAWQKSGDYMITGDKTGKVRVSLRSLRQLCVIDAHNEVVTDLSFAPTDAKFVSSSDDRTARVWDFETKTSEREFCDHGSNVQCCEWHPSKGLVITGSKDSRSCLWDPRTASAVHTFHEHRSTITCVRFNQNSNWLLTTSKDQQIKLYDLRTMESFQSFKGLGRYVTSARWHPIHEEIFVTGDEGGSLMYWMANYEDPLYEIPNAHESYIWDIAWHNVGHLVATVGNDHLTKFWSRHKPGDIVDRHAHMKQGQQSRPNRMMNHGPEDESSTSVSRFDNPHRGGGGNGGGGDRHSGPGDDPRNLLPTRLMEEEAPTGGNQNFGNFDQNFGSSSGGPGNNHSMDVDSRERQ
mmetsp:Transcript_53389/g.61191  ORF Transcript_53389/g.61191 Transcript_53389/m.61191 type:complete len:443 (-) Transcript_53389:854-2182(-)